MAYDWNSRYVLLRLDEQDTSHYWVFAAADDPNDIGRSFNVVGRAFPVRRDEFVADRVDPARSWSVYLHGIGNSVPMAVFRFRRIR
jgi:hypothetical protein